MFCTTLEPKLFTIDLLTVEHQVFFSELHGLREAEDIAEDTYCTEETTMLQKRV